MIEVRNIAYKYPHSDKAVLQDFSAQFPAGIISAVRGANGCGKTTLSKLICGLLRPQSGSIVLDGQDIAGLSLFQIGRKIGYIWQNPNRQLFASTAAEEVAFGLKNSGCSCRQIEEKTERWLEFFHLTQRRDAIPLNMSLGEKQRLALAAVLALEPAYLVLDEPTGGLDRRCRRELGEFLLSLAEEGRGIVIISHEQDFIRDYAGREVVMI